MDAKTPRPPLVGTLENASARPGRFDPYRQASAQAGPFRAPFRRTLRRRRFVCLDVRADRVTCANAGHDASLLVGTGPPRAVFPSTGTVVGLFPGRTYTSESLELRPGESLVLYTDGVSEACNPSGELFGDERLHACFAEGVGKTAQESVDQLLRRVRDFAAGAAPSDDITILVLRRTNAADASRAPGARS